MISVQRITKIYEAGSTRISALRGVDLDVAAGEVVLLMGPSGSGKTTLLSVIGCILKPTSGSVWVGGQDVAALPEAQLPPVRLKHFGFVFQGFNLFPTLTAAENVELALDLKGVRKGEVRSRARELLDTVGMLEKCDGFPSDLSGGQKQRVAIARALAGDPPILLADEPTAALDSTTGRTVMQLLRALARDRGRAVIVVTHDPRVLEFGDRTVRIEDGRISESAAAPRNDALVKRQGDEVQAASVERVGATADERIEAPTQSAVNRILLAALLSLAAPTACTRSAPTASEATWTSGVEGAVAGPGRIEPVSENIQLGSELSGKLVKVSVEEGDFVRAGQILALLDNEEYAAKVEAAEAIVNAKMAALHKVTSGARAQERSEALWLLRGTEVAMNSARVDKNRAQRLFAEGAIAHEEFDRAMREYDVSEARYHESKEHSAGIIGRAREEDLQVAQADLDLANAQWKEAQAQYEKTVIRSPIDGMVLRKHHREGESVSNSPTVSDPIVTVGDTSTVCVRVEIDEADISRVHVGDRAFVVADAFKGQRFQGHVTRIGYLFGRKTVFSDAPAERTDTKVLETIVALDDAPGVPMGLRVDAYIVGSAAPTMGRGDLGNLGVVGGDRLRSR